MSERPDEQETGYPTAPPPRPQPYTVEDDSSPEADAARSAHAPAPAHEQPDAAPESEAQVWRPSATTVHSNVPPAPPWRVPGRDTDTASEQGPAPQARWGASSESTGAQPDPRPDPQRGWATAPQPAPLPGPQPGPHPIWGAQPETGGAPAADPADQPTASYPAASAPAEFVTSGTAAASSADTNVAWRSPGAQPWPATPEPPAEQRPTKVRRRRRVGIGVVVLLVLVALLGGIVLGAVGTRLLWPEGPNAALPALPAPGDTSPTTTARAPDSVAGIAAAALASTVHIEVRGSSTASSGSGMVLRADGYVVTNNHVIAPAAGGNGRVTVTFADGNQEVAEIVGRTEDYDLAVLRVDATGLTPLTLAASDAVVVGDPAVAVGAPLGLEGTVTTGIVSALNRPVEAGQGGDTTSFINAIQTDAAINPGNSGGPLLNGAGEVIGINTAIAQAAGQQTGSIGLGFAIPANQVRRTAEQIIETGTATYPVIGVALDTRYSGEGVQVLVEDAAESPAVTPGGPGAEAGIEAGDIITHFDGQPVTSPAELIVAVRSRAPGDTVVLTVRSDDGPPREVEVVLDEAGSG